MRHDISQIELNNTVIWFCSVCRWEYPSKPHDTCPGLVRIASEDILNKTVPHWLKRQRQLIADQPPTACYWDGTKFVELWGYEQTEPIPVPMIKAEQQAEKTPPPQKAKKTRKAQQASLVS